MRKKTFLIVALMACVLLVAWLGYRRVSTGGRAGPGGPVAAPVEVAPVERGTIQLLRTFSGSLEPKAELLVSPKVDGRVLDLTLDIGDSVRRGQVVAVIDDSEFQQAVAQSAAELEVARANLSEASSALEIARREFERTETLLGRGVSSESEMDLARTQLLASAARLDVARAQVTRAEAALEAERIRLSYTQVTADWTGGDDERVIAGRYVDPGQLVSANSELVRVVELNPLTAVIYVTEKDYGMISRGQEATIRTDAFPRETFNATVERISPVFLQNARQARVELRVENPGLRLKPGMFIRASIVLDVRKDATIVPAVALVRREQGTGLFVVNPGGTSVRWVPTEVGIREGTRQEVFGEGIEGYVVTLGQQLLEDGAPITIPDVRQPAAVEGARR